MWRVIRIIFVLFSLGFFTVAFAQLPPKIMADKHLIHAEQLYAAKDYAEAFKVMEKVIALQQEHSLTLSDEFHFKYAQVALAADSTRIALESVTRYLSATGDEGEFYKEALALMLKAEGNEVISVEDFYNEVIKTEGTCEGLPRGSECWMELTNHPECYFWNDRLREGATAIWAGKCSGSAAQGKGTLTMEYRYWSGRDSIKESYKATGFFQKGKMHSEWEIHWSNGTVDKGPYMNGKRHGYWVIPYTDPDRVVEGPYVEGKAHGHWVTRYKDGRVTEKLSVDGKYLDRWLGSNTDWSVENEGPDENGNGRLIYRNSDGDVWGGPYVNGKRHGQWIERTSWYIDKAKDTVGEGLLVEGKKHGQWIYRDPNGTIRKGSYVNGKKHGQWIDRPNWIYFGSDFEKRFVGEGSYVEDEEQGQWVYRHSNGDIIKAEWQDGRRQDPWFWYDYSEEKC